MRLLIPAVLFTLASCATFGCGGGTPPAPSDAGLAQPREAVVPLLVSAPPEAPFDGTVRIATVFPGAGRYRPSGIQSENGARMAVDELNAKGGIEGRRLTLLAYRTGSFFVDTRHAAGLATRAQAVALVGSNSSNLSLSMTEVAEAQRIVQVSNISTAEDVTWDPSTGAERGFVFRVCVSDAAMGGALARFTRGPLEARRVAILYEVGRAYSQRLAQNFARSFAGEGRVVREFFYLPLETDFREPLRRIASFRPDVLFLPGTATDASLVALQARPLGIRATLVGADGWSGRGLFGRGGPQGPAYYADLCSPPEDFKARYRARFGEEADGCRAVLAYDAVLVIARALRRMGRLNDTALGERLADTRDGLRRELLRTDELGVSGRIRFGPHRDREGGLAILQVISEKGGGVTQRFDRRSEGL